MGAKKYKLKRKTNCKLSIYVIPIWLAQRKVVTKKNWWDKLSSWFESQSIDSCFTRILYLNQYETMNITWALAFKHSLLQLWTNKGFHIDILICHVTSLSSNFVSSPKHSRELSLIIKPSNSNKKLI